MGVKKMSRRNGKVFLCSVFNLTDKNNPVIEANMALFIDSVKEENSVDILKYIAQKAVQSYSFDYIAYVYDDELNILFECSSDKGLTEYKFMHHLPLSLIKAIFKAIEDNDTIWGMAEVQGKGVMN